MAITPKGFTQVANTDPFATPSDINRAQLFLEDLVGDEASTASELPSSGNWVGRHVFVSDQGADFVCAVLPNTWVRADPGHIIARSIVNPGASGPVLGTASADIGAFTVTATVAAIPLLLRAELQLGNGNSGSDRTATLQLFEDGNAVGQARSFIVPSISGGTALITAVLNVARTPSAGQHTWTVRGLASVASAVVVDDGTLTVSAAS